LPHRRRHAYGDGAAGRLRTATIKRCCQRRRECRIDFVPTFPACTLKQFQIAAWSTAIPIFLDASQIDIVRLASLHTVSMHDLEGEPCDDL
jgi:hypothetical protein